MLLYGHGHPPDSISAPGPADGHEGQKSPRSDPTVSTNEVGDIALLIHGVQQVGALVHAHKVEKCSMPRVKGYH